MRVAVLQVATLVVLQLVQSTHKAALVPGCACPLKLTMVRLFQVKCFDSKQSTIAFAAEGMPLRGTDTDAS